MQILVVNDVVATEHFSSLVSADAHSRMLVNAGEEKPTANPNAQNAMPHDSTRKLSRRRTVGDRSTLYESNHANRNPVAPLKDFGFTPEEE